MVEPVGVDKVNLERVKKVNLKRGRRLHQVRAG
jgi:hypothetical protein